MYTEVKNLFSDTSKLSAPVFEQGMGRSDFLKHAREGVEKLYARTEATLRNYRMYTNILEQYLIKYGIEDVQPTEMFIKEMWDRLKEDGQFPDRSYEWATRKKVPRFTRKVVNEYFVEVGLAKRKLVKDIVLKRYGRIQKFSQSSQEAIKWFEQNGRRVEAMPVLVQNGDNGSSNHILRTIHQITAKPLLPRTRNSKIEHAMRFLEYVNKNAFENATKEDVEKFKEVCLQRGVKQIEDYLAHVATFFINIASKGFIKNNPFENVSLKMNGGAVRKDFITTEGIAKIRDLKTLNRDDKGEVRDRLFALLGYDLALRLNEILSLKISDVRKDENGNWFIVLRSEVQKGTDKDIEMMYFFCQETKELLELYINKIRKEFKPTTDYLILSNQWGRRLCDTACATRFKDMCGKLGVTTFYGNKPSPHLLRHSFATLNIEPIGINIPLYEMSQRLRHNSIDTTRKHYIHNNPYLKRIKHEVLQKNHKVKTPTDTLNGISLADLEHWLSAELKTDSLTIATIRRNHKRRFCQISDTPLPENVTYLGEEDVVNKIEHLRIPLVSLRKYASSHGILARDFQGGFKYGNGFKYREDFVADLAKNWISVPTIEKKLKLDRRSFQRVADREKWRTVHIGKQRFVHRDDCL